MELMKSFMQDGRFELPVFNIASDAAAKELIAKSEVSPRGYAYRRLNRFKTVNGKRYQLHATRGWKCVGRAT